MIFLLYVPILFLASTNARITSSPEISQTSLSSNSPSIYATTPGPITNENTIPVNFNWREQGAVTRVKNQGNCTQSDWAFATIGALESHLYLKNHTLVELSEQELIDCSAMYGNHGCRGGSLMKALNYIHRSGISSEQSYPFQGERKRCKTNLGTKEITFESSRLISHRLTINERVMLTYIYKKGPLIATILLTESFIKYSGGIYNEEKCDLENENHQHNVLIVGYGETEDSQKYWIVKNSWGESWGENGYIRIAKDKNICGIAENVYFISSEKWMR